MPFLFKIGRRKFDRMIVSATELKQNLSHYLLLSETEDVLITKNGKVVAKLSNPNSNASKVLQSLCGILPKNADIDKIMAERYDKL